MAGKRVCIIDIPGLSRALLGNIPAASALGRWAARTVPRNLIPTWPAVTCSVQASLTTGVAPAVHGVVANGIATFRDERARALIDPSNFADYRRNVSFWEQSNQLVEAPRFWQDSATGRSRWKTALLFFQNSMPGFVDPLKPAADMVITPKPEHAADGSISSLLWTEPRGLGDRLSSELGPFPLMKYWGPMAGVESSRWIARAAERVWTVERADLQLVYVPHLDYDLQRFGPASPQAAKAVEELCSALDPLVSSVLDDPTAQLIVLSEYAIRQVSRFVQPNRLLAEAGLLVTRETPDGKLIDYRKSAAFAMVDHQVAHVYLNDREKALEVLRFLEHEPDLRVHSAVSALCPHRRAGEILLEADPEQCWLDYRWWSKAEDAPTFAKTVDIHRKPGYDPCELFFDPAINGISQDPTRVRGSHGAVTADEGVIMTAASTELAGDSVPLAITDVASLVRRSL